MPKIYYCLKCSIAKYIHSKWCTSHTTQISYYNSRGNYCEPNDPGARETIYKAHKLVDLHSKPYCGWARDYSQLRRVYIRKYNPAGWNAVGWYCPHCGNFIKTI